MSRFYGKVGFVETTETEPGIWKEVVTEKNYYGDVIKLGSRWESKDKINDDISITNEISILADPYAYAHFSSMRYVVYMDIKWEINSITVDRPRLVLTLGGLYNGQQS